MRLSSIVPLALLAVPAFGAKRHFPHNSVIGRQAAKRAAVEQFNGSELEAADAEVAASAAKWVIESESSGSASAIERRGNGKIRGVNLGGWLVLEEWLMPGLFNKTGNPNIVDEWTWGELQPRAQAEKLIRQHWDTYITEKDFAEIASHGMNTVRIPVGYWAFQVGPGEPYITGQQEYLDKAVVWARQNGLKIMLDLHGAPGSQNGQDHSGHAGAIGWWQNSTNVQRTVDVIQQMAAKYGAANASDVVTMLESLNEPSLSTSTQFQEVCKQYYKDAYQVARYPWGQNGPQTSFIYVIQDGFMNMTWWGDFMTGPEYHDVWIDNHYYQAFTENYANLDAAQHVTTACSEIKSNLGAAQLPFVDAEFSVGIYGCTSSGNHTTKPPTGTCSEADKSFNKTYSTFTRAYWDVQTQLFEEVGKGQGSFFWTWNNQVDWAEWSYSLGIQEGWFPDQIDQHVNTAQQLCSIKS